MATHAEEMTLRFFSNLKLTTKMWVLVGLFSVAFVSFAFVAKRTIDRVRVNGPVYKQIVRGKDVIADILPPPEYIIEAYLLVLQLNDETDPARINELIERSHQLRRDYDDRHAFWGGDLPKGELRSLLLDESYDPAIKFFDLRDSEFIPAIQAGNREKALALARGELRAQYEIHRKAIDKIVVLANQQNAANEKDAAAINSASTSLMSVLGLLVFGVVLFMGWLLSRIANGLSARIRDAGHAAQQVAAGDLTVKVEATSTDEAGQLLGAIGTMTGSLNSLVSRVKKSSIDLMSTATELAATSAQQEGAVAAFGSSSTEIAAAVKEISATSSELQTTMNDVNQVASQTAEMARHGRANLEGMDVTMRQLALATGSISSKLSAIRERAADINLVVTTITKVADQTNLLSVNAAIEAEKAGEYGLGFLVLAREIRRLADQTAVATLDIERIVKEMQGAVTTGVMEMDKFTEEVRAGVASVGQIGTQLGQIVGQVQNLSDRFDVVNEGMRNQTAGARQINDAMIQLTDGARQTTASLKEFNRATEHVRGAVNGLRQEISHFKVGS